MGSTVPSESPVMPLSPGQKAWRALGGLAAAGLLLLPGALTALVWTPINFLIALVVVSATAALAARGHKVSLPLAVLGSLLVGVPPYPNWLWYEKGGLVFQIGASLTKSPGRFVWLVLAALALFAILLLCVRSLRRPMGG